MSDKKSLVSGEETKVSAKPARRKRTTKASAQQAPRRKAAKVAESTTKSTPVPEKTADQAAARTAGDAGFLSAEDLKHFREVFRSNVSKQQKIVDAEETLPGLPAQKSAAAAEAPVPAARTKRRGRGPQKSPTKVLTSIRLDQEVYEYFRDSGRGWQSRINDFLSDKMQRERRSKRRKSKSASGRGD